MHFSSRFGHIAIAAALATATGLTQAAIETIALPSLFISTNGSSDVRSTGFQVPVLDAVQNSPVEIYVSGQAGGYLRCRNMDGCAPFSARLALSFTLEMGYPYYSAWGINAPVLWAPGQERSYGAAEYGDFIDLESIRFNSDPVVLSYDQARTYGLLESNGYPPSFRLTLSIADLQPGSGTGTPIQMYDYDFVTLGVIQPAVKFHYVATPEATTVPEPSTVLLGFLGMSAAAMAARRSVRRA